MSFIVAPERSNRVATVCRSTLGPANVAARPLRAPGDADSCAHDAWSRRARRRRVAQEDLARARRRPSTP